MYLHTETWMNHFWICSYGVEITSDSVLFYVFVVAQQCVVLCTSALIPYRGKVWQGEFAKLTLFEHLAKESLTN